MLRCSRARDIGSSRECTASTTRSRDGYSLVVLVFDSDRYAVANCRARTGERYALTLSLDGDKCGEVDGRWHVWLTEVDFGVVELKVLRRADVGVEASTFWYVGTSLAVISLVSVSESPSCRDRESLGLRRRQCWLVQNNASVVDTIVGRIVDMCDVDVSCSGARFEGVRGCRRCRYRDPKKSGVPSLSVSTGSIAVPESTPGWPLASELPL